MYNDVEVSRGLLAVLRKCSRMIQVVKNRVRSACMILVQCFFPFSVITMQPVGQASSTSYSFAQTKKSVLISRYSQDMPEECDGVIGNAHLLIPKIIPIVEAANII